jgi:AraC-like DNA-binding protein
MRDRKSHRPAMPREATRVRSTVIAEKGTISIHFVRSVADAVRARGLDDQELLREAGISPELLGVARSRVSAHDYAALWRLVIRRLDDEFFGQDSRRMKAGSFALMCMSIVHCSNLRAALNRAGRFIGVLLDDLGVELSETGRDARITLRQRPAAGVARVFAHETLLVMIQGLSCWLVGRRVPILRAGFAYPAPAHSAEYQVLFSTSLRFEQPHTFIEFHAGALELPVVQDESSAKDFLRIAPENILLKYKNAQSLAARIRRRLRQQLPYEMVALATVAREFHTAPATLRRRLRAEGQSYQSIKDDLRRDLAITYLSSTRKTVREIAEELGFLDPSAFHRAFRRWAHTSPGAYRRGERAGPSGREQRA